MSDPATHHLAIVQVHTHQPGPAPDARRYLGVLWRRKWWIVLPSILLAVAAFANASMQEARYRATGEVLVQDLADTGVPYLDRALSNEAERTVENEIELMESRDTQEAVADRLGRSVSVSMSNSGNNDVITVTSEDTDPAQAAADVNDFTRTYAELRREDRIEDLRTVRRQVNAEIGTVRRNLVELLRPLRRIEAQIAVTPDGPALTDLTNQRDSLRDEANYQRSALNLQLTQLIGTVDAIDGSIELSQGGIDVITEAVPPSERYTPQPIKDAMVAGAIGLLLGFALAFAAEFAFDRITHQEDIEAQLPDERFLGAIPLIDELKEHPVLPFGQLRSVGAEAYRALAASVEFARIEKPVTVIHFTSPVSGEGKSTTVANLAAAFAETGARVALVDADVRRPQLFRLLGAGPEIGLSSVLLDKVSLDEALQDVPDLPGVRLLSPGPLPPNPTKMLYARRTEEVFDELRAAFDVVLVDGPPVLPVADALILTQFADLSVVVVRSGTTRGRALRRTRTALARVESADVALVLNGAPLTGPDGYGYYGGYYEADDDAEDGRTDAELTGRRRRRR